MQKLRFEPLGSASGRIVDGGRVVADIQNLTLCKVVFTPGGAPLLGDEVPIPLYWQQYANHEDPGRNASSEGELQCLKSSHEKVTIVCVGTNASREIESLYRLDVTYDAEQQTYVYAVRAQLRVLPGRSWRVTENPAHGEVEFANLYPVHTFPTDLQIPKRYQACYVQRSTGTMVIPHHHLESRDKHDIRLQRGDRFLWLVEDENPVVEMTTQAEVSAGLCAYMWDAHFGYKVCTSRPAVDLPSGSSFDAGFLLYSLHREAAAAIAARATPSPIKATDLPPVYVQGVNTFREPLPMMGEPALEMWPWSTEVEDSGPSGVIFQWDKSVGYDDTASLRISSSARARARWSATTLGPAFRQKPFRDGVSYTLSAFVRTENLAGESRVVVRLHRVGKPGLFDLKSYELFPCGDICSGTNTWRRLYVETPPISPPPDRLHVLLEQEGVGITWFDNVLLEEHEDAIA